MHIISNTKSWFNRRRTNNLLRGLSNETLEDIGLTRFDVNRTSSRRY